MNNTILKFFTLTFLGICCASSAHAGKNYTPQELNRMIESGAHPDQGAVSTETKDVNFSSCVSHVLEIEAAIKPNYPIITIAETKIILMKKLWTNDAAMTISCSALDNKMVITTAPYI